MKNSMDAFVKSFLAVDKDGSGKITMDELTHYVEENHMDSMMVTRWMQLFDPDKTGYITLENFCDKLGLKPEEIKKQQMESVESRPLPSDVYVIYDKLPLKDQWILCEETKRLVRNLKEDEDRTELSRQLKNFADERLGPHWQVAIVEGSYWITFSHLPEHSFQFAYDGHAYLFWKIPA
ncbi:unnamed protein product [Echinostoma caproni]|uniref:Tegumental protein n=1 Tax=Echinostoma caproni TaxID=27848 RepID=A0A183A686_9TREM|nr:unnamed protein product [Echinostoma caproni]